MLFNSYIFILVFLPIVLIGYFVFNRFVYGKSGATGLLWLFFSSLIFYGYQNPKYVLLILCSIFVNYGLTYGKKKGFFSKKIMIAIGVVFNFGLLFYYKYFNFFMDNVVSLTGGSWEWKNIALPLGISFFTFQQVSYVVDCGEGLVDEEVSFIEYAAFVSFFPQLVAGPIVLHSELIPQFKDRVKKSPNYENLNKGLYAFARGLGKKVLLADNLSKISVWGFENLWELNSATAWIVILSYSFQLYFDFSGYCDMALGIAKMFNFTLPVNFDSPFKAKSVKEFWNRWHVTLSRFFIRYVYIPLGGNRKGALRTYINSFWVFFLSGLWHGANWTFIVWGILNGMIVSFEKLFSTIFAKKVHMKNHHLCTFLGNIYTFFVFMFTFIFFRSTSLEAGVVFYKKLFGGGWEIHRRIPEIVNKLIEIRIPARFGLQSLVDSYPYLPCLLSLFIIGVGIFHLKNTQEMMEMEKNSCKRSFVTIILLIWSVISLSDVSEFLYFMF